MESFLSRAQNIFEIRKKISLWLKFKGRISILWTKKQENKKNKKRPEMHKLDYFMCFLYSCLVRNDPHLNNLFNKYSDRSVWWL